MILIADSGGTNTQWALIHKGQVNYFSSAGMHPSVLNDDLLCPPWLCEKQSKITDLYFYGTGCARPDKAKEVKRFLTGWFPETNIRVYSDLMAVAHAAWGNFPGNVAILGTGSSMAFFDGSKLHFEVWAPGKEKDPGSGTGLGLRLFELYKSGTLPDDVSRDLQIIITQNKEKKQVEDLLTHYLFENLNNDYLSELCMDQFAGFFAFYNSHLQKFTSPLAFGGSVAFLGARQLRSTAEDLQISIQAIIKAPIYPLAQLYIDQTD